MDNALLSIGQLARETGCKLETIRYYERIGLLSPPARSSGGHRHYGDAAMRRLHFIRTARGLGFGLAAIRELLAAADGRQRDCASVERIAAAHLDEAHAKLAQLRRLQAVLGDMVTSCRGGTMPECPLIDALYERRGVAPATGRAPIPRLKDWAGRF